MWSLSFREDTPSRQLVNRDNQPLRGASPYVEPLKNALGFLSALGLPDLEANQIGRGRFLVDGGGVHLYP